MSENILLRFYFQKIIIINISVIISMFIIGML